MKYHERGTCHICRIAYIRAMKKCIDCKQNLPLEEFYSQRHKRSGKLKVYRSSYCKKCDKKRAKKIKDSKEYKEKSNAKRRVCNSTPEEIERRRREKRKYFEKYPEKHLFSRAKLRAKKKGYEFSLEVSDIIIPEKCPILNVPLKLGTRENYEYTPSLDRIDNSKGYIKGNIQVISKKANSMKNSASVEELKAFSAWINKMI